MNREKLVNTFFIALVAVIVIASGLIVYKNLHDKEVREREAAIKRQQKIMESFEVIKKPADPALLKTQGYIMYKGKMYETVGDFVRPMHANVLLPEGTKVLKDGRVMDKYGHNTTLENNQLINLDGEIVKNPHKMIATSSATFTSSPSPTTHK